MSLLREYIREILTESQPSATPGKKNVFRGMKITMPTAGLAAQVRKDVRYDTSEVSHDELIRFVLAQLQGDSTGVSWTSSYDVAVSFADAYGATNRGKELHVIFQATIDEEAGYDPISAGEEPSMFWDENEVRFEPGGEIPHA